MNDLAEPLGATDLDRLADGYDVVFCDVFGVLHDGLRAYPAAVAALARLRRRGLTIILLTNSPRLAEAVAVQLDALGVARDAYDAIVSSGDVTRALLLATAKPVYHLGPEVHEALYRGSPIRLVGEDQAGALSCTGPVDDETDTPEDYRPLLTRFAERRIPMICANPDLVAERGNRLVWCAGALAQLYEELGGSVSAVGKPRAAIYEAAATVAGALAGKPAQRAKILAIGDAVPTDLTGARDFGIDAVFIANGVHRSEFASDASPDPDAVDAFLRRHGMTPVGIMPYLA